MTDLPPGIVLVLGAFLIPFLGGRMRQVLTETFVADECIAMVERDKCTSLCGFGTHLRDLVEAQQRNPRDLSSLRVGLVAAGRHSATAICGQAGEVCASVVQLKG